MEPKIAVVGGGLTGLSACLHLEDLGFRNIRLFEASDRLGGKLLTKRTGDFLVEAGPDSIFTRSPEILEFVDHVGLSDQVVEPKTRGFSIWLDGALREIPPGLTRLANIDRDALAAFPHLTEAGKSRVLLEPEVAPNLDPDESVRRFFSRRFGPEYGRKIAEPLFAGTHGGGAARLSMEALYPSYRQIEREHGSLAGSQTAGGGAPAKFISFVGGSEALTLAIASRLTTTQITFGSVAEVGQTGNVDGEQFDAAILAVPAHQAAPLLSKSEPAVAELLSQISAASSIIATFGFDQSSESLGLTGTGFLVLETETLEVRGATWSSNKWAHRSTGSKCLIRLFLTWSELPDDALLNTTKRTLSEQIGIDAPPIYERIDRWARGLPQYNLGHLQLVSQIEQAFTQSGRVFLAGQSYRGVGIPDCVRQGREAAEAVAAVYR